MRLAWFVLLSACVENVPMGSESPWATYAIAAGDHDAFVFDRRPQNPIDGVTSVVGRDYELAFDTSAIYELTSPVEPDDQLDWNKLPGLSDCGTVDLSVDGAMFGWRWRPDRAVLEVTAYANTDRVHRWPEAPMVTLDADDLAADQPLRYVVMRLQTEYAFIVRGTIRGRDIEAVATLPRRCGEMERDPFAWAGSLYFGGTSTAPHEITARMREAVFPTAH